VGFGLPRRTFSVDEMRTISRRAVLAGVALLVACGAGGAGGAGRDRQAAAGDSASAGGPRGAAVTTAPAESLEVTVTVPREARAGDAVRVVLRVRNGAGRAVDVYLRGREPTLDVVVETAAGDTVWRRLEGAVIPAIVGLRPLAPGQTLEVAAVWDQRGRAGRPVEPGDYVVRAALLGESAPLTAEGAPLRIIAR
jgi:hypothetical protein